MRYLCLQPTRTMNKLLLTLAIAALSAPQMQAKEKAPVEEHAPVANLYQPIPRTAADPNGSMRWRVSVLKPTQHYYTKNGVISYRYSQSTESVESMLGDYMGPRSAVFIPQADFKTTGGGLRSYANVSNRNQQGVAMAPHTEIPAKPAEKAKKSARNAETSVELAQQH